MTKQFLMAILLSAAVSPIWAADAQMVEIGISGMTCPFCVYGTEKKLANLPGVDEVAALLTLLQKGERLPCAESVPPAPGQRVSLCCFSDSERR